MKLLSYKNQVLDDASPSSALCPAVVVRVAHSFALCVIYLLNNFFACRASFGYVICDKWLIFLWSPKAKP